MPEVRRTIALTVSRSIARQVSPGLLRDISQWTEGAEYLIWVAGVHQLVESTQTLRDALWHDQQLRKYCALALGRIGQPEDVRALIDTVNRPPSPLRP